MSKNKRHLLSLVVVIIMVIFALGSGGDDEELIGIELEVNDTQFIITNNSPYDWNKVLLSVNRRYELKLRRIMAGETVVIEMNKFIFTMPKEEPFAFRRRLKFDPFTMTPQVFSIFVIRSPDAGESMFFYFSEEEGIWTKEYNRKASDAADQSIRRVVEEIDR